MKERFGICKLSGFTTENARVWKETWHVFDRAYSSEVIARYHSAFDRSRKRRSPSSLPPSVARRSAQLHARRLNVEERKWEERNDGS
jgi:hypothetical protein